MHAVERRVVSRGFKRGHSRRGPTLTSTWRPRQNPRRQSFIFNNTTRSFECYARSGGNGEEEEKSAFTSPLEGIENTVEKMLLESPAVKSAIARITAASERYEEIVRQKQELQQQSEIDLLEEHRAWAQAEAEAAKKRVRAAELRLLAVAEEQKLLTELADRDADRIQSVTAFTVSSIGGLTSLIPILLVEADNLERGLLSILATIFSSGLYGITYRYAVGDGKNVQLKIGVISAFWIVSTLSFAQSAWNSVSEPLSHFDIHLWNRIGLQSFQTLLIFLASTLAMEFSIRSGFLRYATRTSQS